MMLEAPLEAPLEAHSESPEAPPPDLGSRLMMLEAPLEARPRVASRRHPASGACESGGGGSHCEVKLYTRAVSHSENRQILI